VTSESPDLHLGLGDFTLEGKVRFRTRPLEGGGHRVTVTYDWHLRDRYDWHLKGGAKVAKSDYMGKYLVDQGYATEFDVYADWEETEEFDVDE